MPLIFLTFYAITATAQSLGYETVLNDPAFRLTQTQVEDFLREGYGPTVGTVHVHSSVRNMIDGSLDYIRSAPAPYRRAVTFSITREGVVYAASCNLLVEEQHDTLATADCEVTRGGDIRPYQSILSRFTPLKP